MPEKRFSFRWDIDHRACMTDGVPRIQALCRELGVRNTFFVNMGRSTNLKEWLVKGSSGSLEKFRSTESVNLIQKIGWPRFILESLRARPVGRQFIPALRALQEDGHELGLHGGSDHVVWSRRFPELSYDELFEDVRKNLELFTRHFGKPRGFASPGFRSDHRVMRLLSELGFAYSGDAIGGDPRRATNKDRPLDLWTIPVTICGPNTVPFLEWHGAKGTHEGAVIEALDPQLDSDDLVVMYGHPCYEGVRIEQLREVFELVLSRGYEFVTHAEIVARLNEEALKP